MVHTCGTCRHTQTHKHIYIYMYLKGPQVVLEKNKSLFFITTCNSTWAHYFFHWSNEQNSNSALKLCGHQAHTSGEHKEWALGVVRSRYTSWIFPLYLKFSWNPAIFRHLHSCLCCKPEWTGAGMRLQASGGAGEASAQHELKTWLCVPK